tara:strand:- start:3230 stop:4888 length:1659 start_codon:yes stop_codon:yes gene_type:complete
MKLQLISDFNLELLKRNLESRNFAEIDQVEVCEYGQLYQSIFSLKEDLSSVRFIWSLPENHIHEFKKALIAEDIRRDILIEEIDNYATSIIDLAKRSKYVLVPTWCKLYHYQTYGILDWKIEMGITRIISEMNIRLSENFSKIENIYLIDSSDWNLNIKEYRNQKLWYLTKVAFQPKVFSKVSETICTSLDALNGKAKKLIVVDLDNTLWGGVIGDVDFNGINIGGHNHIGEAYKDFQKSLLALHNRGVLLAISSKNQEEIAMKAFDYNTEMVLKKEHFAAWEINWDNKAKNIIKIANDINIGLDSIVFIDDNPIERDQVKTTLPDVYVPDWSIDPSLYSTTLNRMRCFDQGYITTDDKNRTKTYLENKNRNESKIKVVNKTDWLMQLETEVEVDKLNKINLNRVAQLFQKTNQFNLTTRRLSDVEIESYYSKEENSLLTVNVKDKFGELGLVGIIGLSKNKDNKVLVSDLILSCRAMGRGIEESMLYIINKLVFKYKAKGFEIEYKKTNRNNPVLKFLKESNLISKNNITFNSKSTLDYNYKLPVKIKYNF